MSSSDSGARRVSVVGWLSTAIVRSSHPRRAHSIRAVMEVAPGIHRIEGDLGERYVCQYLLVGEERALLVDTGLRDMPAQVIAPYLATLGRSLADLDDVLISHADVDHCGGNRALRAAAPAARVLCGEADRAWIESNGAMLAENYLWYEPYGCAPSPDDVAFLTR